MSYILDALKKSDRERQQRTPPSLSSVYSAGKQQPKGRQRIWPWLICLILLLNAGILLCWMMLSRQEPKTAATPLESQAQDPSAPTAPPVAQKAAENVQAPSSREKEPPPRNSLASNDGSQAPNSAGEPSSASPKQNAVENVPATPPSAAVPPGEANGVSRPKTASESRPRPDGVQEVSPPATVARDKAPEKMDWKRAPDPAVAEAKRPTFGRAASQGSRKDTASAAEGRTALPGARTARSPATADASGTPSRPSAAPAPERAGKAQTELESLVGKQIPFTGGELPQADPPPAPVPDTKPAAPRASSPPPKVPEYEDLPPKTRGEIPFMSFSMFVYSDNPGNRLVGIKGRVVREGQELAPGLKVESIRPDGAILNYNGQRFYKRQF
ncbi:MAG: general secretion pathway protein GspB [Syntrophobacteraceae bacterium]|nr:general secretion pathway protein GspB [Desulfobacteraceae bacterium]